MSGKYILDGKAPVVCDDLMEWAEWMETADRKVAAAEKGEVRVSTVFLGLDHAHMDSVPMLFETMIFGGEHDQYQERFSTWHEAEAGHKVACDLVGAA